MSQINTILIENESGNFDTYTLGNLPNNIAAAFSISSKDNFEISSPKKANGDDTKSINIESNKHIKIKPGNKGQIELIADNTGDLEEFLLKILKSVDSSGNSITDTPIRLKINSSEVEFNTDSATDFNSFDVKFRTGLKNSASGDHYCKTKLKGRSFDIRCYEHGGIALQPCGTDSNNHENKFKIETSRTSELGETPAHTTEGGKGMEIFTMNSEHMSAWAGDYRFRANSPVYAVTRGALVTSDDKTDYPTLTDDFKDIINDEEPVTWGDIIAAVKYYKTNFTN